MTESETARAVDLARGVIERLRMFEEDRGAPGRAQRASTLRECLADTLRHVERAIGRRQTAERRLCEPPEADLDVSALRASLATAERKERDATQALGVAVERVSETLAGWKPP